MKYLILMLSIFFISYSANAADFEKVDSVCLHKATIMKYIDIIKKSPTNGTKMQEAFAKSIEDGECVNFKETKLPVDERFPALEPIRVGPNTLLIIQLIRIRKYWSMSVTQQHDA